MDTTPPVRSRGNDDLPRCCGHLSCVGPSVDPIDQSTGLDVEASCQVQESGDGGNPVAALDVRDEGRVQSGGFSPDRKPPSGTC